MEWPIKEIFIKENKKKAKQKWEEQINLYGNMKLLREVKNIFLWFHFFAISFRRHLFVFHAFLYRPHPVPTWLIMMMTQKNFFCIFLIEHFSSFFFLLFFPSEPIFSWRLCVSWYIINQKHFFSFKLFVAHRKRIYFVDTWVLNKRKTEPVVWNPLTREKKADKVLCVLLIAPSNNKSNLLKNIHRIDKVLLFAPNHFLSFTSLSSLVWFWDWILLAFLILLTVETLNIFDWFFGLKWRIEHS